MFSSWEWGSGGWKRSAGSVQKAAPHSISVCIWFQIQAHPCLCHLTHSQLRHIPKMQVSKAHQSLAGVRQKGPKGRDVDYNTPGHLQLPRWNSLVTAGHGLWPLVLPQLLHTSSLQPVPAPLGQHSLLPLSLLLTALPHQPKKNSTSAARLGLCSSEASPGGETCPGITAFQNFSVQSRVYHGASTWVALL